MSQERENFLDPRTIIAIVLVGAVWFGWQNYLSTKYKKTPAPASMVVAAETPATTDAKLTEPVAPQVVAAAEKTLTYDDGVWSFDVSSQGMGLKHIRLKNYKDRSEKPVHIGATEKYVPLATTVEGQIAAQMEMVFKLAEREKE